MAQGHLTNGQDLQKQRLAETCPPSDFDVACHGKLIKSCHQPETFYNGWYPVRHQCSFPDHEPQPGAGLKSDKGLQFRNYRIICEICDHPDNSRLTQTREKCCWSQLAPARNSVAPKLCEPNVASQPGLAKVEVEARKHCRNKVDAYWRFHDPHYVESNAGLPDESRVHDSNWFKQQIASDNKYKFDKQAYQRCQRHLHLARKDSKWTPTPVSQRKCCQHLATHSPIASPQLATNVAETPKLAVLSDKVSESNVSQKQADM